MDPYTEQRLRDEVMYLHSLWHQGPPNHGNFLHHHSNPSQTTRLNSTHNTRLKAFKKNMKKKKAKKLPPSSDFEWPVNQVADQPLPSSGWPIFKPAKTKPLPLPTAEEQTLLDGIQQQQKALQVIKEFFTGNEDSDGCIDSDDDDEDNDGDTMDEDGNADNNFLVKLFEEDGELRGYYERNKENGQFSCLVCAGIGDNVGKRFKHCVSLVQHSLTIARTKKKKAHRAYSQVVCKVLGWDINKLPSMPLPSDKQPGDSKENAEAAIDSLNNNNKDSALDNDNVKNSDVNEEIGVNVMPCEGHLDVSIGNISISKIDALLSNVENCETSLKENDVGQFVGVETRIIPDVTDYVNGDMMLCESSVKINNADTCVENIENLGNSSGVVNHLGCSEDDNVGREIENN